MKPQLAQERRRRPSTRRLERPLVQVLATMERTGVLVDRSRLSRLSNDFSQRMAGLEAEIHELAGDTFNVGSPKQLGEILFDKLSLQDARGGGGKKDQDRRLSDRRRYPRRARRSRARPSRPRPRLAPALETERHLHGRAARAISTPIPVASIPAFSMAATSTGRLASTDPNLQNIPVRTEEGRQIREAFIAPEGKTLLSLDYSQIELAHSCAISPGSKRLQTSLPRRSRHSRHDGVRGFRRPDRRDGSDGAPPSQSNQFRRHLRNLGLWSSPTISASRKAKRRRFIDAYFEKFPGIKDYMDKTVAGAKKAGYVETLFGRRIHTPEINAKGPRGGFAWRAAINAPIQGSAADVIRRAMIRIPPALERAGLPARMLLQVHDELLFEVEDAAVDETIAVTKDVMQTAAAPAVDLAVPMVVDAGSGANWAAAH